MVASTAFLPVKFDLSSAVSDIYYSTQGGLFKTDFLQLINDLRDLQGKITYLPEVYQNNSLQPFITFLIELGECDFNRIILSNREDLTGDFERNCNSFIPVLAEALLQRNYEGKYFRSDFEALRAFQALVDTIYKKIRGQDSKLPPLAVWTKRRIGAHTITQDFIEKIGINFSVVCLPSEYRMGGLFAWSSLGHEVGGHHFLHANPKLISELQEKVKTAIENKIALNLKGSPEVRYLIDYWCQEKRIEELASDVLGVLTIGPASAIGLIGYFRGVKGNCLSAKGSFSSRKKESVNILHLTTSDNQLDLCIENLREKVNILGKEGEFGRTRIDKKEIHFERYVHHSDCHPIPVLRPFAMAKVIEKLKIQEQVKKGWSELIRQEIYNNDLREIRSIAFVEMDTQCSEPQNQTTEIKNNTAIKTIEIAAEAIACSNLINLQKRSLIEMFSWNNTDEQQVEQLRGDFRENKKRVVRHLNACHVVAAAIIKASEKDADIESIFFIMKKILASLS